MSKFRRQLIMANVGEAPIPPEPPTPPAPSASDYVQSGLIGMWDGIENVGLGTHDNSATSWVDLSGNNRNFVLETGASWVDNAFVTLPSKKLAAQCSSNISYENIITQEVVFEVFEVAGSTKDNFFRFGTLQQGGGSHGGSSGTNYVMRGIAFNISESKYGWQPKNQYVVDIQSTTPPINTPLSIATVYGTGTKIITSPQNFLINNVSKTGTQEVGWASSAVMRIANTSGSGSAAGFYGKVYAMRLYNRALTAEELTYNYNLDKQRFNINI